MKDEETKVIRITVPLVCDKCQWEDYRTVAVTPNIIHGGYDLDDKTCPRCGSKKITVDRSKE